jgi:cell division transport system permease protein
MTVFSGTYRIFKTSVLHITRNLSHTFAAIVVLSLTLLVVSIFVLTMLGMNSILTYFESQPQVTAFFKDSAKEQEILTIKTKLEQTGEVQSIKYVSKQDALNRYKEQNKNEPVLLEMVTADMLPASLEVSATDLVYLPHLADILSKENTVEEVAFHQDVVNTLQKWTNAVRVGGLAVGLIFILASILIVLVTISTNIASRSEEIEIMRLVGASAGYIRWPFIIEGIIYGVVSAIIGVGVIFLLFPRISGPLAQFLAGIPIFPVPMSTFTTLLLAEIGLGVFIGILGSSIAVTKKLKV